MTLRDKVRKYVAAVLGSDDARVDEITDVVTDRLQRYRPDNPGGYARAVAVNAARRVLRRTPPTVGLDDPEAAGLTVNPWHSVDRRLDVHRVLARLTPAQRTALWTVADGGSVNEIAAKLGVSRASAWRILEAARTRFKVLYNR